MTASQRLRTARPLSCAVRRPLTIANTAGQGPIVEVTSRGRYLRLIARHVLRKVRPRWTEGDAVIVAVTFLVVAVVVILAVIVGPWTAITRPLLHTLLIRIARRRGQTLSVVWQNDGRTSPLIAVVSGDKWPFSDGLSIWPSSVKGDRYQIPKRVMLVRRDSRGLSCAARLPRPRVEEGSRPIWHRRMRSYIRVLDAWSRPLLTPPPLLRPPSLSFSDPTFSDF